jgi:Predicted polymerase, most proteins contain PALM domain, HD hydrolase domain and Zn-ribbon domain
MEGRNSYFQLIIKEDGTYLKIYKAEPGGEALFFDDISSYLNVKKIYEYDKIAIGRALSSADEIIVVKISIEIIPPVNEYAMIKISEDRVSAIARFYPPSPGGSNLSKDDIVGALVNAGVKYGLDEQAINAFLSEREYCKNYIMANATLPVQGHDAAVAYHFNTDLTMKPKRNEDGTVDFHQLDIISHCNKGDLLATLTPIDLGKPGIDVCGNLIRPLKVNNSVLRHGNKIHLSEDGLQMYSDVDGHVSLIDGRVFVSDTYEVAADVDASTGDISYEGNVVIKGNVITGYSVRAKGDIEVNGVVEGSYLEAGGQIILKRGMQGMNKGILKANGNIITKFLENSEVYAGGYVSTESILHSKVAAKGDVIVGGKRGFVTGGEIKSGTMISVKTAGSPMGTFTLLEVGIDPGVLEEFRETEKRIAVMLTDKEKIAQALMLFRKKLTMGVQIAEDKKEYLKQITQSNIILETQIKEARKRYDELRMEMENHTSGVIKVSDVVYPGTKIVISNVICFIHEITHHSKFIRDRADIRTMPL